MGGGKGVGGISNLVRNGKRGAEVIVKDRLKGERESKKRQIERYTIVESSLTEHALAVVFMWRSCY